MGRLLSLRAAGRLLGVSPGRTLAPLVRCGAIRTVRIGTRARIPMTEIERIEREGVGQEDAVASRPPRQRQPEPTGPSGADLAAGISDLLDSI